MVLKWRPDGDRGLIAAEGALVSRPLLLSSYFSYEAASLCPLPLPPIIKLALLFYHSLLCQTLPRAIIVCFLCGCVSTLVLISHSVLSLP